MANNWDKYLATGVTVKNGGMSCILTNRRPYPSRILMVVDPIPKRKEIRDLSSEENYLYLEGLTRFQA